MIPKECLPPCKLQCNSAPELDLECETCPHRNEAKPMPGGGERPRYRGKFYYKHGKYAGREGLTPWINGEVSMAHHKAITLVIADGHNAWIQFERKNGMC